MDIYKIIDKWSEEFKQPARQFKTHPEFKKQCLDFLKTQYNINPEDFKGNQNTGPDAELFWFLKNRRTKFPTCPITSQRTTYRDHGKYCKYAEGVASKDSRYLEKRKESIKNKYGVYCSLQTDQAKEKAKETCLKKYGVPHHMMSVDIHQNAIRNCQSQDAKIKRKETCLERYNSSAYIFSKEGQQLSTKAKREISYANLKRFSDYVIPMFSLEEWMKQKDTYLWKDVLNDIIFEAPYKGTIPRNPNKIKTNIELTIQYFLEQYNIKYEYGNRNILNGKEIDFYLPDYSIGIELHGLFWHSEYFKNRNYHYQKYIECKKQNIQLIQIFSDEIQEHLDIVLSRLKNKLGIYDRSIFARKCIIKEIDYKNKKDFLEKYHLQGNDNSSICLGAFYNDELISVMTFSKKRFGCKENNTWELMRYCLKEGVKSTGLASKLFTHFTRKYTPQKVISFADSRWSMNGFYNKLGFEYTHHSKPGYFYIKNCHRLNRMLFQKHKLPQILETYDPLLSEHQNMLNNNYLRIFDCGNDVFEWTPN